MSLIEKEWVRERKRESGETRYAYVKACRRQRIYADNIVICDLIVVVVFVVDTYLSKWMNIGLCDEALTTNNLKSRSLCTHIKFAGFIYPLIV